MVRAAIVSGEYANPHYRTQPRGPRTEVYIRPDGRIRSVTSASANAKPDGRLLDVQQLATRGVLLIAPPTGAPALVRAPASPGHPPADSVHLVPLVQVPDVLRTVSAVDLAAGVRNLCILDPPCECLARLVGRDLRTLLCELP